MYDDLIWSLVYFLGHYVWLRECWNVNGLLGVFFNIHHVMWAYVLLFDWTGGNYIWSTSRSFQQRRGTSTVGKTYTHGSHPFSFVFWDDIINWPLCSHLLQQGAETSGSNYYISTDIMTVHTNGNCLPLQGRILDAFVSKFGTLKHSIPQVLSSGIDISRLVPMRTNFSRHVGSSFIAVALYWAGMFSLLLLHECMLHVVLWEWCRTRISWQE